MIANPLAQIDIDSLRNLVQITLAELGQFEPDAFPLTQRVVERGGTPCGFYFCLHGPRSVKLTAICDLKSRAIFFYGTNGQRLNQLPISALAHYQSRSVNLQKAS